MQCSVSPLTIVAQCSVPSVVICASHPTLGPVYWCFTDGADHNAPSCYTLTTNRENALTLPKGWRDSIMAWNHRDHMAKVMADEDQFLETYDLDESDDGAWETATILGGMLKVLQERSGQSPNGFSAWLTQAAWLDKEVQDEGFESSETYLIPQLKPSTWQRMQA